VHLWRGGGFKWQNYLMYNICGGVKQLVLAPHERSLPLRFQPMDEF
jgi:hypothetical protein